MPDKNTTVSDGDVDPLVMVMNDLQAREGLLVNRSGRGGLNLKGPRGVVSLESRHALHWLAAEYCRINERSPKRGELKMLAMVLQGIAAALPVQTSADQELWDRIDDEPVIQAVMAYLEDDDKGYFKGTMTDLRKVLTETAVHRNIAYTTSWPPTANQLSRRLNDLEPLLRAAGYRLTRHVTNQKRYVNISPIPTEGDDVWPSSSPASSPRNPEDTSQIGSGDDGDDPETKRICRDIDDVRRSALKNDLPISTDPYQENRDEARQ